MPRTKKIMEDITATEIEAKKKVRATGRKVKEKVEKVAADNAEDIAATEIEAKKTARATSRKVKEKVEDAAAKVTARKAKLEIVIQSKMGGAITPEEIAKKVPSGTTSAYVKVEENKIYWVNKKGETGSVDIW